ncbi:hypothetical protein GQ44DRAFT_725082 [Phaeosphaeriaceae sp. PMI808]|nr:hypothetical protein GQ44DRAFT_725082 [Phaeosphaeriaceae sp. PMI808]
MTAAKKRADKKQASTRAFRHDPNPIFPFLKLPGEIRNMIYTYALVDTEYSIRFGSDVSKRNGVTIVQRLYSARHRSPDRDDLPGQTQGSITKSSYLYRCIQDCRVGSKWKSAIFHSVIVVNLLRVFSSSLIHLPHAFLIEATATQKDWATFRPERHGCVPYCESLSLLAYAVNLEALYLNIPYIKSVSGRAHQAACGLFQIGHTWMHALAVERENKLAVLDVIKLPTATTYDSKSAKWYTDETGQREFRNGLAARLTVE